MSKFFSALPMLFLSISLFAEPNCPDVSKAPKCPTSGSILLDDTYPVQAFVISNAAYRQGPSSVNVTRDFILNIFDAYNVNETPNVILPVWSEDSFNDVKKSLRQKLTEMKMPAEEIELRLKSLTHYQAPNYTWQQDWFESFIDKKSGRPMLRQLQSYERGTNGPEAAKQMASTSKCPIVGGEPLRADYPNSEEENDFFTKNPDASAVIGKSFGSGEMGGNIEGAPGGLCLLGDNMGNAMKTEICGDLKNVIEIKTSWLRVGHVDEIFKILPTFYQDGRPKECQFSLMVASPRKALELMKESSAKKRKFFEHTPSYADANLQKQSDNLRAINSKKLCLHYNKKVKEKIERLNPNNRKDTQTKSAFLRRLYDRITTLANEVETSDERRSMSYEEKMKRDRENYLKEQAKYMREYRAKYEAEEKEKAEALNTCESTYKEVLNHEMLEIVNEDQELKVLNELIQASIDEDVKKTREAILAKLPQCQKYFNIIEAPSLFEGQGTSVDPKTGKKILLKPGEVDSILPGSTNGVVMNKNYLIPDSENGLFNDYLESEMSKRKINMKRINTWEYAHMGKGNMHCSSHSIPYCSPNE